MANALATPMAVRAPTAPPTAAPLTQGQNQANQLANSGGSNAAYMAARGAAPIKTLGTAPLTATPKTATLQAPPMAAPPAAPQFTPLAQVSKPPAADDPRNREIPTNGDLQKMQSLNAQPGLSQMQQQVNALNTQQALANAQPFQWGDQHAQMFSQMMSQPGLPDNVKMALQQAQDHFAGGGPVPPSVAKTGERERQPQMPQPAGQPPTAPRPFKGRTTSMQRRGKGVGQPARSLPMTPTRAAQNYVQNTPFTPLMG